MNKHYIIALLLFIICSISAQAQDTTAFKEHKLNFRTQFFQIKEAANYGLVFSGLNLIFGYDYISKTQKNIFIYSPDFSFGADFRKGVGLNWHFKPADFFYGWHISKGSDHTLFLGP